ncbi:Sodium-dependent phosphate transporter [Pseudomonas sp. OF001]|uniref:Na/Pi cotransporter family protein n=1 Tax=Pseudomonas sp. OF001 TaxID=2772300 RepID=UPI0019B1309A|nr:Na/Pi symporter [Pseudomonas sp. OF001]CAD5379096.1 Sodium-dependent phosphate transporter [Pseudomonas sp. OF001]
MSINKNNKLNAAALWLLVAALAVSFWFSPGWTRLAGGLALFLFGMQCLEEGLRQLAGSELERILGKATDRAWKSLGFGIFATVMVQSSTLVSLLAIAFLGTGLIGLAAGLCIVFGANLGTTSGIWLLAMIGQSASLGSLALPLAVFGILLGFNGPRSRGAGRVLLGVCFLFLGIDLMKGGFSDATAMFDPARFKVEGVLGILLFTGIGALVTAVVQSSHASLMLVLTALASGQIDSSQGFALAIGTNVGGVLTAVIGSLGGARAGQRLALANVIFNWSLALLALLFLQPLTALVLLLAERLGFAGNALLELALFHSLFNGLGLLLFIPWHGRLALWLERLLPEPAEPHVLIAEVGNGQAPQALPQTRARYLDENALGSAGAAVQAVARELQHLARLSLEVICHALYLPVDQLNSRQIDDTVLRSSAQMAGHALDAEQLYQRHIKGVYADLLSYMGRLEASLDEAHNRAWIASQLVALQLVDAVKDAKHLQKNLSRLLVNGEPAVSAAYADLRRHLLWVLREMRAISLLDLPAEALRSRLDLFDSQAASFDTAFRERLFAAVREQRLDGLRASSLMNDLGYASRIGQSLRNVLLLGLGDGREVMPQLPFRSESDEPLIQLESK